MNRKPNKKMPKSLTIPSVAKYDVLKCLNQKSTKFRSSTFTFAPTTLPPTAPRSGLTS